MIPTTHNSVRTAKRERQDLWTVLTFGVLAISAVLILAIRLALDTFTPSGIAWRFRVLDGAIPAAIPGIDITGTASQLHLIAEGVNPVSTACIIAAFVLVTAACLHTIGSFMFLAHRFLRGEFFSRATARAITLLYWTIIVGAFSLLVLPVLGGNGVRAAIGAEDVRILEMGYNFWSVLILAFALSALSVFVIAFRRAARMQRDQEGLV